MERKRYLIVWILMLAMLLTSCGPKLEPGAKLMGENLSNKDLAGIDLSKARLSQANLSGTDLSGADLQRASLRKADLTNANLSGANLEKANLTEADLTHADLSGANLKDADLTGADLTGVNLDGAIFDGAVLARVEGLSDAMLNTLAEQPNVRLHSVDELVEVMEQVCDGEGISEAAPYTQAPGIHPIVIIGRDSPSEVEDGASLSIQATELVACVGVADSTLIETCEYDIVSLTAPDGKRITPRPNIPENSKYTVTRYRVETPVRLVEARTGNVVVEAVLPGIPPEPCRGTTLSDDTVSREETRYGERPTGLDILGWLEPYVLGVAPPLEWVAHDEAITSASFSPNGQKILTSSEDKTVRLWDTQGNLLSSFDALRLLGFVAAANFSPDGEHIVIVSYTSRYGTATVESLGVEMDIEMPIATYVTGIWDTDANLRTMLEGGNPNVRRTSFSPDGTRIILPGDDFTARVWDLDGNELLALHGHTKDVISADYSPAGDRILTVSQDDTARLWDVDGNLVAVLEDQDLVISEATFSPDGDYVLTVAFKGTNRLWDADGNLVAEVDGSINRGRRIGFCPDSTCFAASSADKGKMWDMEGQMLESFGGYKSGDVTSVNFGSDGKLFVTTGKDATSVHLRGADGELLTELKGHTAPVTAAVFNPDGTLILTAGDDGRVRLHEVNALLD